MERTIKHLAFTYRVEVADLAHPGRTRFQELTASQGETVDIPFQEDIECGEKYGAFVTEADLVAPVFKPLAERTEAELAAWIRGSEGQRPQEAEVVLAAGDDPELARRLMTAEYATGSRHDAITGLNESLTQSNN